MRLRGALDKIPEAWPQPEPDHPAAPVEATRRERVREVRACREGGAGEVPVRRWGVTFVPECLTQELDPETYQLSTPRYGGT